MIRTLPGWLPNSAQRWLSPGSGAGPAGSGSRQIALETKLVSKTSINGIPSKENGVDIEGIGAMGESLYLGFRGPVLRGNWAPVMKLEFEDQKKYEFLYVNLGGRGIRDITRVSDGFLLIAGPVGDGPTSYQLYHWDGKDMIPGEDRDPKDVGKVILLGEIDPPMSVDPPARAKAEGIVVLTQRGPKYDLILVYDSGANGAAQRFRVSKP